jgi:antibiotic biosynthesis monooxygenase (ABM) superfamily enzyme
MTNDNSPSGQPPMPLPSDAPSAASQDSPPTEQTSGLAGWFNRTVAPDSPLSAREVTIFAVLAGLSVLVFLVAVLVTVF